jgi:hypothetical protein
MTITYDAQGQATAFDGPDAIDVFRSFMLARSLKLWADTGIIPTRGVGPKRLLALASAITHQTYRCNATAARIAAADVLVIARAKKAAIDAKAVR